MTALSLKNIDASVKEIERTVAQGFRAVLLYPHVDGEMLVDTEVMEPIYKKISEHICRFFCTAPGRRKVRRSSGSKTAAPASLTRFCPTARSPSAACA
jgi:hypothetical protein